MAKRQFAATVNALKKSKVIYIEIKDRLVYLSNGHIIAYIPYVFYTSYFVGRADVFPLVPEDDNSYTIRNGEIKEDKHTFCFDGFKNMSNTYDYYLTRLSPLMLEMNDNKTIIRTCFYRDKAADKIKAIALNNIYALAMMDFLGSNENKFYCTDPKNPIWYTNDNIGILVLPININTCPDLEELVLSMNAEAELRRMKAKRA